MASPAHVAMEYRSDIDGLRALAVLAVVIHHLSPDLLSGGFIGVDVFFVISGYLITKIISNEMAQGTFTFVRFYERRVRRILPALFAMMSATLVVGYVILLPSDYAATLRAILSTLIFSSNILFWRELQEGYFAATDLSLNPLLHTWSLSVEEQFYLVYPVFLFFLHRLIQNSLSKVLLICASVSFISAALLVSQKNVAVFFLSPFRGWELLVGSILALGAVPTLNSRIVREILSGTGLLAIAFASIFYRGETTTFPGVTALAPVLGAAAIIHAGGSGANLTSRLLSYRPMVYIGLISYSLYLWHWPLLVFARYVLESQQLHYILPTVLTASFALAIFSYHLIEQPFRRPGSPQFNSILLPISISSLLLFLTATVGINKNGFTDRFTSAIYRFDEARLEKNSFLRCRERLAEEACTLGKEEGIPTVLLWGDSHMMSWAEALDTTLKRLDLRGTLMITGGCPPLFGVINTDKNYGAGCNHHTSMVREYLHLHPEIDIVVMSSVWHPYFLEKAPLKTVNEENSTEANGQVTASRALSFTLLQLQDENRKAMLIGPVPVYEKSVPLKLALEEIDIISVKRTYKAAEYQKNAGFFSAVQSARTNNAQFVFSDPINWMCKEECLIIQDSYPIYRDTNHLNKHGAMLFEDNLFNDLKDLIDQKR